METLCEKLQNQIKQRATVEEMLLTVQMIQSELMHIQSSNQQIMQVPGVAIQLPSLHEEMNLTSEEKEVLSLDIDDAEIAAELEQIKKNAETKNSISANNRPRFRFDPVEDTPTLMHQTPVVLTPDPLIVPEIVSEPEQIKETAPAEVSAPEIPPVIESLPLKEVHEVILIDESDSLNEILKEDKEELSETLQNSPIKDLKKAIGINDRFLFINELFQGDETSFERSIKTINGFSIYAEAEYWIRRELKTKLGWDLQSESVKQFDALVKRRFPST
ncbi:MAG: hypothetical protein NT127_00645 [Sphingobacteriales bacterium]|nr:hypothetical protein [Sphingobacteriales bacterium]